MTVREDSGDHIAQPKGDLGDSIAMSNAWRWFCNTCGAAESTDYGF
jgi:hypothetical protein